MERQEAGFYKENISRSCKLRRTVEITMNENRDGIATRKNVEISMSEYKDVIGIDQANVRRRLIPPSESQLKAFWLRLRLDADTHSSACSKPGSGQHHEVECAELDIARMNTEVFTIRPPCSDPRNMTLSRLSMS